MVGGGGTGRRGKLEKEEEKRSERKRERRRKKRKVQRKRRSWPIQKITSQKHIMIN